MKKKKVSIVTIKIEDREEKPMSAKTLRDEIAAMLRHKWLVDNVFVKSVRVEVENSK